MFQEWWIVTCRPTSLRVIFNHPNRFKHCELTVNFKFVNWFLKTIAEQLMNLLCSGVPVNWFWAKNCKKKELQQNSCLTFSWLHTQSHVDACCELKDHLEMNPDLFFEGHYWWWNLVLHLLTRHKAALSDWKLKFTTSQNSLASGVQSQDNADLLLFNVNGIVY